MVFCKSSDPEPRTCAKRPTLNPEPRTLNPVTNLNPIPPNLVTCGSWCVLESLGWGIWGPGM